MPEELIAMLETLDRGTLRGLRDRAMLLIGFAGGLRRSEIVALDVDRDQTEDGRGSSELTCPVVAVETWLKLAKLAHGPLFRRVIRPLIDQNSCAQSLYPIVMMRHGCLSSFRHASQQWLTISL